MNLDIGVLLNTIGEQAQKIALLEAQIKSLMEQAIEKEPDESEGGD